MNILEQYSDFEIFCILYVSLLIRYAVISGGLYLLLYKIGKIRFFKYKIQSAFPHLTDIKRELNYSWISLSLFVICMLLPFSASIRPYAQLYGDIKAFGWAYFIGSCLVLIMLHDTYFYWTHRLLHARIFARFHVIHHKSTNPTPLSAFSFHPFESLIQVGFFAFIPFVLPLHLFAIGFLGLFMFFHNAYGHSGYDFFKKDPWGFNTSKHHNLHHKKYHGNYGLYFTFWDRIMKTGIKT